MNGQLPREEITRRLHLVMDAASALPIRDIEQVEELIQVGERAVAFVRLDIREILTHEYLLPPRLDTGVFVRQKLLKEHRAIVSPNAAGRAVVGNAAFGADACAGEGDRTFRAS